MATLVGMVAFGESFRHGAAGAALAGAAGAATVPGLCALALVSDVRAGTEVSHVVAASAAPEQRRDRSPETA